MSGGVDSSVAAALLKRAGYDVVGLFMRNWDSAANQDILGNPDADASICPQEQDYQDASDVAEQLGIPLHRVDFVEEYWRDVFTYFLHEYERGRTPNPDILCNKYIKFDAFARHAETFDPDYIAMGHYARVRRGEKTELLRGLDRNKDQTYFLSQLTASQLERVLFPVGEYTKEDVRRIAEEESLPTAEKKDSTGICFIGERAFDDFLRNYLPAKPGKIKTRQGDTLGEHAGLMHYTIGQRKGLGIGGLSGYPNEPWFVIGKDLTSNTLYVGQGYHHEDLYSDACTLENLSTIDRDEVLSERKLTAKFRYRAPDEKVRVRRENGVFSVYFDRPVRAVTPGQACVFYDGEVCLGGGFIDKVYKGDRLMPY